MNKPEKSKVISKNSEQDNLVEMIKGSGLFDESFYQSQLKTKITGDLITDFLTIGWKQSRNPNIWFDIDYYLEKYPDVAKAGLNPFLHFLENGYDEGREPNDKSIHLDIDYYLARYVVEIPSGMHPYQHFYEHGIHEGFLPNKDVENQLIEQNISLSEYYTNLEKKKFVYKFYKNLYEDISHFNQQQAEEHYSNHGKHEGRFCNFTTLLDYFGFTEKSLPIIKLDDFYSINPLLEGYCLEQIYILILQVIQINLIRFSKDDEENANFYEQLGELYLVKGDKGKAKNVLLYSNYLYQSSRCCELLGNMELDENNYSIAAGYYESAIANGGESYWLFINLYRCYDAIGDYENVIKSLLVGLSVFPLHSHILGLLDHTVNNHWNQQDGYLRGLAKAQQRTLLMEKTAEVIGYYQSIYQQVYTDIGVNDLVHQDKKNNSLNSDRVLIVGDYHISQCIRYRINQKVEQLSHAGYTVSTLNWLDIAQSKSDVILNDIIIIYRSPALPQLVKVITQARALDKIIIFEIDDLIFNPIYPADYSEYAGGVSIEEYGNLTHGMALFHETARMCDYALASTNTIKDKLAELVTSKTAYLHRNGLDFHNENLSKPVDKKLKGLPKTIAEVKQFKEYANKALENPIEKATINNKIDSIKPIVNESKSSRRLENLSKSITIFYGSGTLAHNTDFINIALPAIEKVLNKYPNVRFMAVGHLTLPSSFIDEYAEQLIVLSKTETITEYWQLLAHADINLAVLENNEINNGKSELKWFEAACFETPSIISATENYIDVIDDKKDGILADTPEDWYQALELMIHNEQLRIEVGKRAYQRIQTEYSVGALTNNIDSILKDIVKKHGEKYV